MAGFKIVSLCVLLLPLSTKLFAQEFGGNPPSLHWKQINTKPVRIIFPNGEETTAQRVTSIINQLNALTRSTIGTREQKVNVVFQTQTTISNAYVNLGPFRSEFFLTPSQNSFELGSLPWAEQ